ncbi:holo-ACP synthase [Candidatus Liberibacter africanus]|uniref:Holo-[acyl-carrier-protein] synthase n=1 Tax=Candidatus Liberibacter africanus PTSAPSY TaxID=1277257 RepID=A0A0G3I7Y7_LIBAF|nr:holo-ACP synthase [Candidatus Liberibacter africanus]AKK20678.1 4'-phosphopantetheinyl transferase [Candidatus Liberibacter africanus PTSAPSY]QTP64345.1 holo-ACP synthase [Candidatus Liberibacter africanus]
MIVGIGSDIVNIRRIERLLQKFDRKFELRCFSSSEQNICDLSFNRSAAYAKRFASKEAFSKAIGTGISHGISWKDIEVGNLPGGKPYISVSGRASCVLYSLVPKGHHPVIHLTISDDFPFAQAFVVIESRLV